MTLLSEVVRSGVTRRGVPSLADTEAEARLPHG
jgi:hypothetical protein